MLLGYNRRNKMKVVSMIVKKLVLMFCCLLCIGFSGRALAAEQMSGEVSVANQVLFTRGVITALEDNRITVEGEGAYTEIVLNISQDTYLNDGKKGRYISLKKLAVGDKVSAFYGPAVTRSMPPQGNALAVVKNSADNELDNAIYIKAGEVYFSDDKVNVLNSNGDLIVGIERRDCRKYKLIKPGSDLLVWYKMVALSMPGQTNATRAVILEHK